MNLPSVSLPQRKVGSQRSDENIDEEVRPSRTQRINPDELQVPNDMEAEGPATETQASAGAKGSQASAKANVTAPTPTSVRKPSPPKPRVNINDLCVLTAQLSLSNARTAAAAQASSTDTLPLKKELKLIQDCREVATQHFQLVAKASPTEKAKMSPVHLHMWQTI